MTGKRLRNLSAAAALIVAVNALLVLPPAVCRAEDESDDADYDTSLEEFEEADLSEIWPDEQDADSAAISESASKTDSSSTGSSDAVDLIEDPEGNTVNENIKTEITDEWYKEQIALEEAEYYPVYGKLYPPAPLLDGINSFRQGDLRWGRHPYGYANAAGTAPATISSSGCGLMSLVNAVYYMTGNMIDPAMLADWSTARGYRQNGVGTVHALYQAFAEAQGSSYGFAYAGTAGSLSSIRTFLAEGGSAIISTDHHLMAVVDYNAAKGGYLLLDSAPSSYRGTYPTGYRYLSDQDFADSIPIYAIILLKPSETEPKPLYALANPALGLAMERAGTQPGPSGELDADAFYAAASENQDKNGLFLYLKECYLQSFLFRLGTGPAE